MSFDVSYYPGMPVRDKDFEQILAGYAGIYGKKAPPADAPPADATPAASPTSPADASPEAAPPAGGGSPALLPGDLYHFSLQWLLSGQKQRLYDQYVFNIRPATDARPYYTAYLKPGNITYFLDQLGEISEEWGYLLLLSTLLVSVAFGLLIILIPVVGRWRDLFRGRQGTFGIIVYYACLGMGYMLVEIYLIQRLSYFLADPIFSVSIVVTSMLIISALGSLYASRFASRKAFIVRAAVLGVAASLLFYIFLLPTLIDNLIALPLGFKLVLALLFIAPAAFFMGIPFPTGLSALESGRARLLPWALGMNGALSVTGAVASKVLSVSYGFPVVLAMAIVLYLIVGVVYMSNEARSQQAAGAAEGGSSGEGAPAAETVGGAGVAEVE